MDTQIVIKTECCENYEIGPEMSQANASNHHLDPSEIKQEKVEDDSAVMEIKSDPLCQDVTNRNDPQDIKVELETPIVEEIIIKNEILDDFEQCKNEYSDKKSLECHTRVHTKVNLFERSERNVIDKSKLQRHVKIRSKRKSVECEICKKKYADGYSLRRHIITHTELKPFECEMCKKTFADKNNLTRHLKIHAGLKPSVCEICKKKFSDKQHLKEHMRIHTGEKPFACTICKTKFRLRSHMSRHMGTHTGEKLYACDICHKRFSRNNTLQSHMNLHTGEKPFECGTCKKQFHIRRTLSHHIQRHHAGEKLVHLRRSDSNDDKVDSPIEEKVCLKTEISSLNSAENASDKHGVLIDAKQKSLHAAIQLEVKDESTTMDIKSEPSCQELTIKEEPEYINVAIHPSVVEDLTRESEILDSDTLEKCPERRLLTESKEKRFQCSTCKYRCFIKSRLQAHMRIHTGEKPFECYQCNRKFADKNTLSRHIPTHSGVKRFECKICKKEYSTRSSLRRHTRTHTGEKLLECTTQTNANSAEDVSEDHSVLADIKDESLDAE